MSNMQGKLLLQRQLEDLQKNPVDEYPQRPPKIKFIPEMWHPNIEKNGNVCI
ncbi:Ubiquitin-conjugating enzyme E2 G1 [Strongyloides ratti]|uniref:Ubiquitin-conjugating enzyme E2 G1 n=1 Tax=Strongyloides ratti TaxID=34506 RepID=A0A090L8D0_STRRB|nr:Ubiquitin-conjugating enzyme E2 G1 [Strongyloides ratti]CEF66046.1 Ubiquitin-conjugating enzyme E2 G1 [Strongyloides ratti]